MENFIQHALPQGTSSRVMVAMSGGVDSAVAAYLLQQQGYSCIGVTLVLHDNGGGSSDVYDARRVADRLGIPHEVFHLADMFDAQVIRRFTEGYLRGQTPNPCVDCNRYIKFGALGQLAKEMGIEYLATGHYAQTARHEATGKYLLKKAADSEKDQSYVLFTLTPAQLRRTLFPLGGLHKQEVRALAHAQGFENAQKRESQDICFVPNGHHAAFIEQYTGQASLPGDFVDTHGQVLGRHLGLSRYTVGQRKGLGLALHKPMFVCKKDTQTNTVTLCEHEGLFTRTLQASDFNWIARLPEDGPFRAKARTRYRQPEQWATVTPVSGDMVMLLFDEPQRAIAAGQAVVLYDGDTVIGGGTIQ